MEILTRGTCRFFFVFFCLIFFLKIFSSFFDDLLVFLFYTKLINILKRFFILVFSLHFISERFVPHIGKFTLLLHSKIQDIVYTVRNLNIIKSNNQVRVVMSIQSQKTFSMNLFFTSSLQYILHLLHIILKLALPAWQVPRSSVGRALYRECGPSQDGNPVPGNFPFFFILCLISFLISFFDDLLVFPFYRKVIQSL